MLKVEKEIYKCLEDEGMMFSKELNKEDKLINDLGFDSLSLVSLIIAIEDNLDIKIDESELDPSKIITFGDLCNLVKKYCIPLEVYIGGK